METNHPTYLPLPGRLVFESSNGLYFWTSCVQCIMIITPISLKELMLAATTMSTSSRSSSRSACTFYLTNRLRSFRLSMKTRRGRGCTLDTNHGAHLNRPFVRSPGGKIKVFKNSYHQFVFAINIVMKKKLAE